MASSLQQKTQLISLQERFLCYENSFCDAISDASMEFLGTDLGFKLVSVSYEPVSLWKGTDYFVSQVSVTKELFATLKISDTAAEQILLGSLGERTSGTGPFRLKNMTELEAGILTAYNEFLYGSMSGLFLDKTEINSVAHTLKNEKTLYMCFYVYKYPEQEAGRLLLSFPEFLFRKVQPVPPPEHPLNYRFFNDGRVNISIIIGKTTASLNDVKNIEPEDILILDHSSLYTMYLKDFEGMSVNINPNHSLVINFDEENGDEDIVNEVKKRNTNIWDSLEIDVTASFEKLKMKLGDLREITEGLVIDVASIADNKVYIEVENKLLAAGELVIIGDRYGVKVTEISGEAKTLEVEGTEEAVELKKVEQPPEEPETPDEDVDDSDFELGEEPGEDI